MSDQKNDPKEVLAWTAIVKRVQQIEDVVASIDDRIRGVESCLQQFMLQDAETSSVTLQLLREARRESVDEFQLSIARAKRQLYAPPDTLELVQLRDQVAQQAKDMAELREMVAMSTFKAPTLPLTSGYAQSNPFELPVASATPVAKRKPKELAPAPRGSAKPDDFAPDVVVPPPGIRGSDDDIPKREMEFVVPASMRFEGSR
jgi:hypothetical protein